MAEMFKIPSGMENIMIHVSVLGKDYEIPAVKQPEEKLYRIPHKVLSKLFKELRSKNRDLRMETGVIDGTFVGTMSPKYSLAGCRISNGSIIGDTYYGETNVTIDSSSSEKEAPFASAVNRAQDKAVLDFIGLESQYFDKDGKPALYSADSDATPKKNDPAAAKKVIVDAGEQKAETPVQDTAPEQNADPAPVTNEQVPAANEVTAPVPAAETAQDNAADEIPNPDDQVPVKKAALTVKEEQEFQSLCEQKLKLRQRGQDVMVPLSRMSDAVLKFLMESGNEAYANLAGRYMELKKKREEAA